MRNEYIVTKELYKSWIWENKFKGVRLVCFIIYSIISLVSLLLGINNILRDDMKNGCYFLLLFFLGIYLAIIRDIVVTKKQYEMFAKAYGKENWTRIVSFEEDGIVMGESTMSVKYDYDAVVNIRDKGNKIWLDMGNKGIIRMYKNSFINGDWEKFKKLIADKQK